VVLNKAVVQGCW